MTLLIDGPKKAHKQIKKLIAACRVPLDVMDEPFDIPSDDDERYQRALELVYVIGKAAGEELDRTACEMGEKHLCRIFREGMLSEMKRKVVGSGIEKAVFECGQGAGTIVLLVRPPKTKEVFNTVMSDGEKAFMKGVAEWAA
jgi:hypothetical protein